MSKLEVDNRKLDFRSTAQSKKYILKMVCLMVYIYITHVRSQRPECQRGTMKAHLPALNPSEVFFISLVSTSVCDVD